MAIEQMKEGRKEKLKFRSIRFLNGGKSSLPLIFLLAFLFSIAIAPAAYAADGNFGNSDITAEDIGTKSNPYLIDDEADLKAFRDIVNGDHGTIAKNTEAHAKLTADIDLDNESWTPIGNSTTAYTGIFDGGGYAIDRLSVSALSYAGFFGYVGNGGVVKNLTIASGNVSGTSFGGTMVAGIVAYNSGTVQNCINSATVSGQIQVGGIVGYNSGGTVQNCVNLGSISGSIRNTGGIVGYNNNYGTVQNCVNSGSVSGSYVVGGIVGNNGATVQNCGYLKNENENINSSLDAISSGSGTNVGSFSLDAEDKIAVTLSASIGDDVIEAVGGETTINLSILPGNLADVVEAGGLAINEDSGLIDLDEISNGTFTVTAKGAHGTAEISVTLYVYDYDSYEYTDEVALSLSIPIYVGTKEITSITISPRSLNLAVGKTHTLTLSYDPEDTALRKVKWTSDDTNIATVDENGKVTGVNAGTTTITATSTDDEEINDSCDVTVTNTSTEQDEDDSTETETDEPNSETKSLGPGGCNAGTGALALLALIPLALRRKR